MMMMRGMMTVQLNGICVCFLVHFLCSACCRHKRVPYVISKVIFYITINDLKFAGKCSAASLDVLSSIFNDDFLPTLLPILKETLFHNNWLVSHILFGYILKCHLSFSL